MDVKKPDVPKILSTIKNRSARARRAHEDYLNDDVKKPVIKTEVPPNNETTPSSSVKTSVSKPSNKTKIIISPLSDPKNSQ